MLTEKEISEIANKYITEIEKRTGIELLIGDKETIKKLMEISIFIPVKNGMRLEMTNML